MAKKTSKKVAKKVASLGAEVPADVFEEWSDQCAERGQKSKRNLLAAAKLWLSLPAETQASLLSGQTDSSLEGLVRGLILKIQSEQNE